MILKTIKINPFKKSSHHWIKKHEKDFEIMDYDGWDRNNLEEDLNKKISHREFVRKAIRCTVSMKRSPKYFYEPWYTRLKNTLKRKGHETKI
jgi:hypothetical protein